MSISGSSLINALATFSSFFCFFNKFGQVVFDIRLQKFVRRDRLAFFIDEPNIAFGSYGLERDHGVTILCVADIYRH